MKFPYPNQPKVENLAYGLSVVKQFLEANGYKMCKIKLNDKLRSRGLYYGSRVELNLKNCKNPVTTPGFSWSYTGNKSDVTPAGVLAHEFGHHVDYLNNWRFSHLFPISATKKRVSGYEPNKTEIFAETMRIFILNPDLLRVGHLERYNYLISLGLKPVVEGDWKTVLYNAHPSIIKACESFIKAKS